MWFRFRSTTGVIAIGDVISVITTETTCSSSYTYIKALGVVMDGSSVLRTKVKLTTYDSAYTVDLVGTTTSLS